MNSDLLHGFYLGDSFIEPLTGKVSNREGSTHLPPKAVEVLLCLARSHGELVTREELLENVWGEGHGSRETLSHAISEIRHALGDQPNNPGYVQTLPKRGYRLLLVPAAGPAGAISGSYPAIRNSQPDFSALVANLKRRGVLETGFAYLFVGWLIIQVADVLAERLPFPAGAATYVTWLVIAGFPIALIMSWYFEFRGGRAVLHDPAADDAERQRLSPTYVAVIAALGLAAVLVYAFDNSIGLPESKDFSRIPVSKSAQLPPIVEASFAVLPFLNIDGSEETQIFANGLVEDVISRLSRVPGLRVSARGDSFSLQPNSSSRKVRERLRVKMYLEGSVQMLGDTLRTTVQLINTETGFHILSRKFDRPREDFFDVRDEITSLTVANIRVALPPGVGVSALSDSNQPSLDAYVLYRRGMDVRNEFASTGRFSAALEWFDKALEVDPQYAAAHAGKCIAFVRGYSETHDVRYVTSAQSSCAMALGLNANLDIVHTALGDLYRTTGQLDDAEVAYKKALAINESSSESLTGLGDIYRQQNRMQDAETSLNQAVGLHPGDASTYRILGLFLYSSGRFEEAAKQYEFVVGLEPENTDGYQNLGAAYMLSGNFEAAAPAFQTAIDIEPHAVAYSNLGLLQYFLGDLDAAIESHSSAIALEPNDVLARSNLGDALWISGRKADARATYEKAEELASAALSVNANDPYDLMDIAWIRAMLDKPDAARSAMDRSKRLAPDDPYTHYYDALVFLRAGDTELALDALEIAADKGYSRKMLAVEPLLVALRTNARFIDVIKVR